MVNASLIISVQSSFREVYFSLLIASYKMFLGFQEVGIHINCSQAIYISDRIKMGKMYLTFHFRMLLLKFTVH